MSIVRVYHAGCASEIQLFLNGAEGLAASQIPTNWLGRGIYLWESDHRSQAFWKLAEEQAPVLQSSTCKPNDRSQEYFGQDVELITCLRPDLEQSYAGIRMAFCLDEPVLRGGHLFPRQQIQICLWNCQVIRSPRKYVGSSFRGL
jgi:hypothetical protein